MIIKITNNIQKNKFNTKIVKKFVAKKNSVLKKKIDLQIFDLFASHFSKHLNEDYFNFILEKIILFDAWIFHIIKILAKKRNRLFSKNFNSKEEFRSTQFDFERIIIISNKKK